MEPSQNLALAPVKIGWLRLDDTGKTVAVLLYSSPAGIYLKINANTFKLVEEAHLSPLVQTGQSFT